MKPYYLQRGCPDNHAGWWHEVRVFLDDRIHPDCDVEDTIVADSWVDARRQADA